VIDRAGATPHQLTGALLEAQAIPATWEIE